MEISFHVMMFHNRSASKPYKYPSFYCRTTMSGGIYLKSFPLQKNQKLHLFQHTKF